ncbi:MAG: phosphoribosylglycinamide formyltransferase [Spirochaetales bacterium]|nr:phosphoribosylglycinamide formyltransferase [Spirochaetales bacterium]
MARAAALASGQGSNFQALAEAILPGPHRLTLLICDRPGAFCLKRAEALGIPSRTVKYEGRPRGEAEAEILRLLEEAEAEIVFLAGFMRLLSPGFIDGFKGSLINIHPALLPRYPGAHGIAESYASGDRELGITIHQVDYGMDTGPVLYQASFTREGTESAAFIEEKIHALEHLWYPRAALELLDALDRKDRTGEM